jgi:Phosphodiester glycosidase
MRIASRSKWTALAFFGGMLATSANAATITISSWIPQYEGISLAQATIVSTADSTTPNTSAAFIERIDLTAPGIGFITTPSFGPLETVSQTTSQFLQATGTQVAISDVEATAVPEKLIGLAVSNGSVVAPQTFGTNDAAASLVISKTNQAGILSASSTAANLTNVFNAVSGNQIVTNGVDSSAITPTGAPHDPFGLDPRSAVGLSQNDQYLYLIAIDGRQTGYSVGTTTSDEAASMIDLGIYNGLNLDGGGSTALVDSKNGTPTLVDSPSGTDGQTERYVGNNLGVYADPLPTPEPASFFELGFGLLALFGGRSLYQVLKQSR